jgi:hypothetical protein
MPGAAEVPREALLEALRVLEVLLEVLLAPEAEALLQPRRQHVSLVTSRLQASPPRTPPSRPCRLQS